METVIKINKEDFFLFASGKLYGARNGKYWRNTLWHISNGIVCRINYSIFRLRIRKRSKREREGVSVSSEVFSGLYTLYCSTLAGNFSMRKMFAGASKTIYFVCVWESQHFNVKMHNTGVVDVAACWRPDGFYTHTHGTWNYILHHSVTCIMRTCACERSHGHADCWGKILGRFTHTKRKMEREKAVRRRTQVSVYGSDGRACSTCCHRYGHQMSHYFISKDRTIIPQHAHRSPASYHMPASAQHRHTHTCQPHLYNVHTHVDRFFRNTCSACVCCFSVFASHNYGK